MTALQAGKVVSKNPYNGKEFEILMHPDDVDCIVFWTKNPSPLIPKLKTLDNLGFSYYFQFTLNDYPKFEKNLPSIASRIDVFKQLSSLLGSNRVVWRFDPILLSSVSTEDQILASIASIAKSLEGYTNQLIFSFADIYSKVERRLSEAQETTFKDVTKTADQMIRIAEAVAEIAKSYQMTAKTCAESYDFKVLGIEKAQCIDPQIIQQLTGGKISEVKDPGQRKECGCIRSRDIGNYEMTCHHQCLYCYAQ